MRLLLGGRESFINSTWFLLDMPIGYCGGDPKAEWEQGYSHRLLVVDPSADRNAMNEYRPQLEQVKGILRDRNAGRVDFLRTTVPTSFPVAQIFNNEFYLLGDVGVSVVHRSRGPNADAMVVDAVKVYLCSRNEASVENLESILRAGVDKLEPIGDLKLPADAYHCDIPPTQV